MYGKTLPSSTNNGGALAKIRKAERDKINSMSHDNDFKMTLEAKFKVVKIGIVQEDDMVRLFTSDKEENTTVSFYSSL